MERIRQTNGMSDRERRAEATALQTRISKAFAELGAVLSKINPEAAGEAFVAAKSAFALEAEPDTHSPDAATGALRSQLLSLHATLQYAANIDSPTTNDKPILVDVIALSRLVQICLQQRSLVTTVGAKKNAHKYPPLVMLEMHESAIALLSLLIVDSECAVHIRRREDVAAVARSLLVCDAPSITRLLVDSLAYHMTDKRESEAEVRDRVISATASLLIATVDEYGLIQCRAKNELSLLSQLLGKVVSGSSSHYVTMLNVWRALIVNHAYTMPRQTLLHVFSQAVQLCIRDWDEVTTSERSVEEKIAALDLLLASIDCKTSCRVAQPFNAAILISNRILMHVGVDERLRERALAITRVGLRSLRPLVPAVASNNGVNELQQGDENVSSVHKYRQHDDRRTLADLLPGSDDEEDEDENNVDEAPQKDPHDSDTSASDIITDTNDTDDREEQAAMDVDEVRIEEDELQTQDTTDQQPEFFNLPVHASSAKQQVVHIERKPNTNAPVKKITSLADVVLSDESDDVELIE